MKRKKNIAAYVLFFFIFKFMNICQIFSSNYISQTYISNQSMCCIELLFD